MAKGKWVEAIRRWEQILDQFGPASSWSAYRGLIVSYSRIKRFDSAEAVASRARVVFPESVELAVAWAGLPMAVEDWPEAVDRWNHVLEEFGATASWKPYEGLTNCYQEMGDIDAAVQNAEQGRRYFPDAVEAVMTWAELPMVQGDWLEAIDRGNLVLDRFGPNVPWQVHVQLAIAHGKLGDLTAAAEMLNQAWVHDPNKLNLIPHTAELAMARRDWPEALRQWNELLPIRVTAAGRSPKRTSFPRRGSQWDWHEEAWQTIVSEWNRIEPELAFEPTPDLYRALAMTLDNAGLPKESLDILRIGAASHPEDQPLAFDLAVSHLGLESKAGRAIGLMELSKELDNHPLMAGFFSDVAGSTAGATRIEDLFKRSDLGPVASTCVENLETMAGFGPTAVDASDELGSAHVIRAPYGSSIELQLRAGRYFTQSIIEQRVREVSERDAWEEMTSPENLMFKRARALADDFGRRFEDLPLLSAGALSDAVLFFVFQELAVYEPMRRLAIDIASESDNSPVFIESPTDTFPYVDGYFFSHFDVLYLYFELRKRGVNAFVVRYHAGRAPARPRLGFVPGVRSLLPRGNVRETDQASHRSALVPAGIRSVRRVVSTLDSPLVFSSGSVVKEFAYDRSLRQEFPIEPEATFHPKLSLLPTFRFDLWSAATLRGVSLRAEDG
ncbi:MAG: tetratricopeptide repeat protein, partial [Actinomycetota bacterium]|nr:tetratricopeptide repeat protein [Actinomycetota bacterium]